MIKVIYLSRITYKLVNIINESDGVYIMLVKTIKVKKPWLILVGGILIALLVFLIAFGIINKVCADDFTISNEDERQSFIKSMGWEVSKEYSSCKVVTIPAEFNEVYEKYNEIQKEQGFNLEKYKGEKVEIYTYEVYNCNDGQENVYINIMVYEDKLIGGDVSCTDINGFMQGLKKS